MHRDSPPTHCANVTTLPLYFLIPINLLLRLQSPALRRAWNFKSNFCSNFVPERPGLGTAVLMGIGYS